MSLAGMLEKLYARRRFGIRPGLDRIRLLLDRLGNPEQSFRSIHVVGTNGKGSTASFLSSILKEAGQRTALFTSPHLVSFGERFRINGQPVESEQLAARLDRVLRLAPDQTTFFEIVTALAACCFAEQKADIAVMEAGMGGRSDATAALRGIMTVITPISLDHCDYLGTTLEQIATEKAGIIEAGSPAIVGRQPKEVLETIRSICQRGSSGCQEAGQAFSAAWSSDGTLDYHGLQLNLSGLTPGIPGRYQAENAALALAAAETVASLGLPVNQDALRAGLAAASWPGRMELIPGEPPLLLDGAHNPAGAAALVTALADYHFSRLLLVTGIMADKNAHDILGALAPLAGACFCVTPAVDRAMDDRSLAALVEKLGIPAMACGSVANGIASARLASAPGDLILICGSLFTVGEAKACLAGQNFEGIRG